MNLVKKALMLSAWCFLAISAGGIACVTATILYLTPKLPDVETLRDIKLQTPLRIYSKDNQLIAEFGEKRRTPIRYEDIPATFIQAILTAEDQRFYTHPGVDMKGLGRAVTELITTGEKRSGGSTITMQVARNFFLTSRQTYLRKFNEILLALQIERELSKNEILELYVNKIYLGHRAYGIEAAANVYYGKSIHELTTAQLAMIASLPKAPSRYNPITDPERSLIRRNWILTRMHTLGYLNNQEFIQARNAPITASFHAPQRAMSAPYIAEMARLELEARFGQAIYEDGYIARLTINSKLQSLAQNSVYSGLMAYDQRHGYRGPENQITLKSDPALWPVDQALNALKDFYSIGPMHPAVVLEVQAQEAIAVKQDGQLIKIPLSGMQWARRHFSSNRLGSVPQTATEVLSVGDIVRVTLPDAEEANKDPEQWAIARLSQIPKAQSAFVVLSPQDGAILALVGGLDFRLSKFNRVTQAGRQAGSGIKPFIYAAALQNGFTAASIINDAPLIFTDNLLENVWRPENSGGNFAGPTRLREALYKSRNLVSIRLLQQVGIPTAIQYLSRFGFDPAKLPQDLSLALGSASLTPLEIATAYTAFANGGYQVESYLIDLVTDTHGTELFKANPPQICVDCEENNNFETHRPIAKRIVEPRLCYIMRSMLQDVIKRGTGSSARVLERSDLAGKTGTTNDQKDAWFSGFNDSLVATAWVGFDQPETLGAREYGGTSALPIWMEFMREALKGTPETVLKQPDGIVTVKIDPTTGQRAQPGQTNAIFEMFRAEHTPPVIQTNIQSAPSTSQEGGSVIEEIF